VALTLAEETYAGGEHLLQTLAGLSLSHFALEQIVNDLGETLVQQREAEIACSLEHGLESSAQPDTLCISADGVKVPMRKGWEEARVVSVYRHERIAGGSEPEAQEVVLTARVEDCEATGRRMYAQAQAQGLDHARRVVVIGDGAEWIWNQSALHFAGATEIVDWYHAVQHLWEVAGAVLGAESPEGRAWEQVREAELWAGRVDQVLSAMRRLFWSKRRKESGFRGSAAEHVLQTNLAYFTRHQRRMDYARFRAEDLPLGSGVVEAGCKHLVAQRCKRSGMQWHRPGLHAILELRSALVSNRWDRVQALFKAA